MTNHSETLKAIDLLLESIQFLQETSNTRLNGFSVQFLLDMRRKIEAFHEALGHLVNRKMRETGDARPFIEIEDVRGMK